MTSTTNRPINELIDLNGRTAVVTGGARGIGRAIATRLAEAGATVAIADLSAEAADATATELVGASAHQVDMRDSASVTNLADTVLEASGHVDIWVNNAGVYPFHFIHEIEDSTWDNVVDLNLSGTFRGAREAARVMTTAGNGGVIINVASTIGFKSYPGTAHYAASKAAVLGLTRSLAIDLGQQGIRVLAIAPTYVETPGTNANEASLLEHTGMKPDDLLMFHPLGRLGRPDDVARAVLFAASDLASYMTGSTLVIDGGALA